MSTKYGRTFHLPSSPGATKDDKIMSDLSQLLASSEVIATEKMDGENTTIFSDGCHPRSPDARYHPSRDWMKAFAAGVSPQLAPDERVVGEYVYARHSIAYEALPTYFMGFAWILGDTIQSWEDTQARLSELGISSVPELFRGPFSTTLVDQLVAQMDFDRQEGFVIRTTGSFTEAEMATHLGKYVRADHVQSDIHWMKAELVKNGLA
ncbi:RNA ligase family protein [Phaeobacter gallaeciensis]|uniref:RNA ligase family protein n=1 Tax=Phaeobacter TaxID=302485 RepID=UPI00237F3B7E|nr:RNA ligase family protein [Phaeobacter gallaeciensis]MDE4190498.1 RNA ligase family protein [Phaeobacter gallaeciensis]MDE4198009.1 RNA ligase family protein [Phaeobacter gallaeciensis]MDE4202151.1 RNA ligase family protein [Phaeobacter gallaeciensis]MDE4206549.1 RNA ligase family protein [Phaeobacter gallaeciensis]MDE4214917.1 RNA ligase family protein [Phaeobacter gallaeciensis]